MKRACLSYSEPEDRDYFNEYQEDRLYYNDRPAVPVAPVILPYPSTWTVDGINCRVMNTMVKGTGDQQRYSSKIHMKRFVLSGFIRCEGHRIEQVYHFPAVYETFQSKPGNLFWALVLDKTPTSISTVPNFDSFDADPRQIFEMNMVNNNVLISGTALPLPLIYQRWPDRYEVLAYDAINVPDGIECLDCTPQTQTFGITIPAVGEETTPVVLGPVQITWHRKEQDFPISIDIPLDHEVQYVGESEYPKKNALYFYIWTQQGMCWQNTAFGATMRYQYGIQYVTDPEAL